MRNRRIALKASVLLFTTSVCVSLTLPANLCLAAPTAVIWAVTAGASAQMMGSNSARRAADDLVREARAAIKRGDFARAEKLINDAEKLGVKYDPLMDRWSDTPDSMRKLLAQERSKANAAKIGSKIPALLGGKPQQQPMVPSDPVTTAPVNPQAVNNAADQVTGDQKSLAASFLRDARAALARGDKFTALAAWQKAAGIKAQY